MDKIVIISSRTVKLAAMMLLLFGVSVSIVHSYAGGPDPGLTGIPSKYGIPAEITCIRDGCHADSGLNPDDAGQLSLTGLPDNYVPGQTYELTFSLLQPKADRVIFGFQATSVADATFLGAGSFSPTDSRTQVVEGELAGRQYIEHTQAGTVGRGISGGNRWNVTWAAPSNNVGDVSFYMSGNAANGDGTPDGDEIYNTAPLPLAGTKGQFTFTNIASTANIGARTGQGVAVGDYDKDGDADVLVVGDGQYTLYRNTNGTFADVSMAAGLTAGGAQGRAAAWGDLEGDGDLDLYIVNAGADRLYRNNGDGTFADISTAAGISDNLVGHTVVWADFDGNRQMDLYVANEGQDDLYVSNGSGTFRKVDPAAAGLTETAASWSVTVADYNADNRVDIFVANNGQDALYRNNGNNTFTNVTTAAGIQTASAMGRAAAWADFDKDGKADLFIANVGADLLYKNKGDGTFQDVTATAGVVDTAVGAAVTWSDYDKDGDQDLFVANEGQDFLYRNNGNGTFNEVATASGLTDTAAGRSAAWGDVTGDGNVDLVVVNGTGGSFLYRNPGKSGAAASAKLTELSWVSRVVSWFINS